MTANPAIPGEQRRKQSLPLIGDTAGQRCHLREKDIDKVDNADGEIMDILPDLRLRPKGT